MKKILALILALVLLAAAGLASAASLECVPGAPTEATYESFQLFFNYLTSASGYTFTWDEATAEEDGYTVYTAVSEDETMRFKAYVKDGNVSYIIAEGSADLDMSDMAGAQKFGEWFGVAISGGVFSMKMAMGDSEFAADPDLTSKLEEEIKPLTDILENDFNDASLAAGKAAVTTVFGYPVGMEVSGSSSGTTVTLNMKIIITGADGQISVAE